ncbi:hypothetical protein ACWGMK_13270 [Agrobacterium deltaense]
MARTDPSLHEIQQLLGTMCGGNFLGYHFASNHEDRLLALETILEHCYDSLVSDRQLSQNFNEDALTTQIVRQLQLIKVEATHDTRTGGHCDIHVTGADRFLWIAEAKIHRDFGWLQKGFAQISTRYGVAGYGRDHGEILIYCRVKEARKILEEWKNRLITARKDVNLVEDLKSPNLHFRTCHQCATSGLPFYIRHRIVPLYWAGKVSR